MSDVIMDKITPQNDSQKHGVLPFLIPFASTNLKNKSVFSKKLSKRAITNTLNHLNFVGKTVFANLVFVQTGEEFLVTVHPEPCSGEFFTCRLPQSEVHDFSTFEFKSLILDDGQEIIHISGKAEQITKDKLVIRLPEKGFVLNTRQAKRFQSSFIEVILRKGDLKVIGKLDDFSASGLKVLIEDNFSEMDILSKHNELVQIRLFRNNQLVYTGFGTISRVSGKDRACVVIPSRKPFTKYAQRRLRHPRLNTSPSPRVEFYHPLVGRMVSYDVVDLTTSGFSIKERSDRLLFLPGMTFNKARLVFSGEFNLNFSTQAIYIKDLRGGMSKLGFSITDIDPVSYRRLFNLLTRSHDSHSLALGKVSADALWQFFFKTGFVYPEKYKCIEQNKEHYLKIYDRLYNECPELFASIIYQQNDELYGHVSLFRAYPGTWMVQHLAALPLGRKRTGLFVLNHVLNFLDGAHRMKSIGMNYLVFNYRPENKFPNFFFGGVCRRLNDPKMCSIDVSAYISYPLPDAIGNLPTGWEIMPCNKDDIAALHEAYHRHSQGLFIESLCLECSDDPLWKTYENHGLMRSCRAYALKKDGDYMAFFILERSDRGLNLSDLLNSIRIFLSYPDPKFMPWDILQTAISILGREYHSPTVVLQVFPLEYCKAADVIYNKRYTVWVAKTRYFDPYFDAIKQMTRFSFIKYIKSLIEDMLGLHSR
jgi:hypothetical protein